MTNFYLRLIDRMRRNSSESRLEAQLWLYVFPAFAYFFGVLFHIDPKPNSIGEVIFNYFFMLVLYALYMTFVRGPIVKMWKARKQHQQ